MFTEKQTFCKFLATTEDIIEETEDIIIGLFEPPAHVNQ